MLALQLLKSLAFYLRSNPSPSTHRQKREKNNEGNREKIKIWDYYLCIDDVVNPAWIIISIGVVSGTT